MKRLVLSALLAFSLLSISPAPADAAKPSYCRVALQSCVESCRGMYSSIAGIQEGCITGCNIGYLLC